MKKVILTLTLGTSMGILSAGCSLFGKGTEERPSYQVVLRQGDKEIRKYDGYLVAKTTITGSFKEAQSKGFRILAGYIFGKNTSRQKIGQTGTVLEKSESQKISMTAPVVMAEKDETSWTMTFSMPSQFTTETLPTPTDPRVIIEKVEPRIVAAITYSGLWRESLNADKSKELSAWLKGHQEYEAISKPMFAGYNPPWTIPSFRRNETLIELKRR